MLHLGSEKLEFARAVACLGKLNSPEMRAVRSGELAEMATIKGTTIQELEDEIHQTQNGLDKVAHIFAFCFLRTFGSW